MRRGNIELDSKQLAAGINRFIEAQSGIRRVYRVHGPIPFEYQQVGNMGIFHQQVLLQADHDFCLTAGDLRQPLGL